MNIKEKIQKLLALATSPNENEAKSALLKAKELMMANKLTEADFVDKKVEVAHVTVPEVTWTTDSGRVWMATLCELICDNYLCVSAWNHTKGSRTYTLQVTGMENDVEACVEIVKYAASFVLRRAKETARRRPSMDYKVVEKSYAMGFVAGLDLLYDMQKEEHPEWGLVEVQNKKVEDYRESLSQRSVRSRAVSFDPMAHMSGKNDGLAFNPRGVLQQTR